jgi:hypothetical protein
MKLNKNSKLAKLYKWYYNIYYDHHMPTSLCTYAWIFDKILSGGKSVGKYLSKKFSKVINLICPNIFWE